MRLADQRRFKTSNARYEPRSVLSLNIFFFQAEDGIRDWSVTGVQTCALPISLDRDFMTTKVYKPTLREEFLLWLELGDVQLRSEERRVGKECRSRWSPYH